MEWEPDEQAWHSYIKMELRYKELDRARNIYERFVQVDRYARRHLHSREPHGLTRVGAKSQSSDVPQATPLPKHLLHGAQ